MKPSTIFIPSVVALVLALFLVGCDQAPTGPINEGWDLKYDKLFDHPTDPPGRPPLPCGWSVVDGAYVYDVHADTCNGGPAR